MTPQINYPHITDYIRETITPNSPLLRQMEQYARQREIPIACPETACFISVLAKAVDANNILEIGTAIGYSSIILAQCLKPLGRLTTIEKYGRTVEIAIENIKKAGLENTVEILEGDAGEVLPTLDTQFDFIFLDGAKGQYLDFLPHCVRLLRPGGVLVSDNVLCQGMVANHDLAEKRMRTIIKRMKTYLKTICNHDCLSTSIIPIGDGVALSYKIHGA